MEQVPGFAIPCLGFAFQLNPETKVGEIVGTRNAKAKDPTHHFLCSAFDQNLNAMLPCSTLNKMGIRQLIELASNHSCFYIASCFGRIVQP